jgi:hypothetical protein
LFRFEDLLTGEYLLYKSLCGIDFGVHLKPTNGKYLVYIYDVAILGWVNEQDVEFVPFDSSYRRFSFLMYAYAARTFITGKEVCPFMKYKYIDANTVEISVTNTWNTMQPKYQKKIEEDALTIWVAINYYDDKQPYCIKFMYQEKELATRCSDKAFVKRASENGKTFSLDSFF